MSEGIQPTQALPPEDAAIFSTDLGEILRALHRRWWLVLACVVAMSTALYLASVRQPKVYRGTATIIIDPDLPKILGDSVDDFSGERAMAEASFYFTQYDIIKSRAVVRKAIEQLQLTEDRELLEAYGITAAPGEPRMKALEDVFSRNLDVAPERQSRLVKVSFEDFDADRAARIANAVCQVYIDQSLEGRLSTTRSASRWLDERVVEFQKQLETSEDALAKFQADNTLLSVSLEDRKSMTTTSLTALNDRLMQERATLIALESERRVIGATTTDAKGVIALSAVPRVAKSAVISQLKGIIIDIERQRADLLSRYGERHPNVTSVDLQLAQIRQAFDTELKTILATLDNEIAQAKSTETGLLAEIQRETQKAMHLNNLTLEYNRLNRDVTANKKVFETLRQRQTEAGLSGLLESNFVRWLETAEPRPKPVRPSVPVNTALGAALGLLLGVVIVIGGLLLDNTVHTQADVEERLHLNFLGLLPTIKKDEKRKDEKRDVAPGEMVTTSSRDLYIAKFPNSSVAECVRSLRTNLLFLGTDRPLKRVLFTSAGPSEGKSTAVIALGTTMALAGNRVLIVDTDLRRPRVHKTFGVSGEDGITSALLETCSLDAAIKQTDVRGLDVLPCGPLPPNPSELFHGQRFLRLVEQISERYDRVFFDSPPINVVTDAAILSRIVDGTVLVVKASKTTKEAARRAARQLLDVDANILGVVLNDADLEAGGYYQGYYYGYRHRYGVYTSEGTKG
ncbi:polysaccharide biosynthesis tyrosine autokinase [Myxococcota bacterium]|nr:polysaccharide biosynthesis tyrosine autokinase [Myxococcota bacterium]